MDSRIAKLLNTDDISIRNCFDIFSKTFGIMPNLKDKCDLYYLLYKTTDIIKYDYIHQKIYIYLIIFYSNFGFECQLLNLDTNYINKIFTVIHDTNITHFLFKLL